MATNIDRESNKLVGHDNYAQVEPNHLSAPRDGGIFAQLPADSSIKILEQGTFVKYDYSAGKVNFTGDGPWMMVFNEEKLYDERKQMHRDYAMKKEDFYDGVMVPRVFRMSVGDIYTTNNLAKASYNLGDKVAPNASTGILDTESATTAESAGTLLLKVVKETTMPDGQPAVKLQVIHE